MAMYKLRLASRERHRKGVDADVGVKLRFFSVWWTGKAVRFMNNKSDIFVVGQDSEGFAQGGMDRLHKSNLFFLPVSLPHLNKYARHYFLPIVNRTLTFEIIGVKGVRLD